MAEITAWAGFSARAKLSRIIVNSVLQRDDWRGQFVFNMVSWVEIPAWAANLSHNHMHKAIVCPTVFRATFVALFVLKYCLREFLLSAVANRFELWCQSKAIDATVSQNLSLICYACVACSWVIW